MRQRHEDIAFLGFSAPLMGPGLGLGAVGVLTEWRLSSAHRAASGVRAPASPPFPLSQSAKWAPGTPAGPWHRGHWLGSCWGDWVCPQLGPHCRPSQLRPLSLLCMRQTAMALHVSLMLPTHPACKRSINSPVVTVAKDAFRCTLGEGTAQGSTTPRCHLVVTGKEMTVIQEDEMVRQQMAIRYGALLCTLSYNAFHEHLL